MTVEEAKKRKDILQKEIFTMLSKFEQESGMRVNHVSLGKSYDVREESSVIYVKIETDL